MHPVARVTRNLAAGAALALALATPALAADPEVIASGLDNPRGIDTGPGHRLFVAEAGRGGAGPCIAGPDGNTCYGPTGAITRVDPDGDNQKRIRTGLPSLAAEGGADAGGPQGISFPRRGIKDLGFLTIGLGGNPADRAMFGAPGALLATLQRLHPDGRHRTLADLGAFEASDNPDKDLPEAAVPDTNPTGLYALNNREAIVADAGGNSILSATRTGEVKLLAVIPFGEAPPPDAPPGVVIPVQSVPTSVAVDKDGSIYVSQLTGFPFPTGGSKIWKVPAGGGTPVEYASGLTLATDLALGEDGSLYVVQISAATFIGPPAPGSVVRIKPDGTKEDIATGLEAPYGIALHDEHAYVTHKSTSAGEGEVVRIALPDDDD